jgi:hypothetical protein
LERRKVKTTKRGPGREKKKSDRWEGRGIGRARLRYSLGVLG